MEVAPTGKGEQEGGRGGGSEEEGKWRGRNGEARRSTGGGEREMRRGGEQEEAERERAGDESTSSSSSSSSRGRRRGQGEQKNHDGEREREEEEEEIVSVSSRDVLPVEATKERRGSLSSSSDSQPLSSPPPPPLLEDRSAPRGLSGGKTKKADAFEEELRVLSSSLRSAAIWCAASTDLEGYQHYRGRCSEADEEEEEEEKDRRFFHHFSKEEKSSSAHGYTEREAGTSREHSAFFSRSRGLRLSPVAEGSEVRGASSPQEEGEAQGSSEALPSPPSSLCYPPAAVETRPTSSTTGTTGISPSSGPRFLPASSTPTTGPPNPSIERTDDEEVGYGRGEGAELKGEGGEEEEDHLLPVPLPPPPPGTQDLSLAEIAKPLPPALPPEEDSSWALLLLPATRGLAEEEKEKPGDRFQDGRDRAREGEGQAQEEKDEDGKKTGTDVCPSDEMGSFEALQKQDSSCLEREKGYGTRDGSGGGGVGEDRGLSKTKAEEKDDSVERADYRGEGEGGGMPNDLGEEVDVHHIVRRAVSHAEEDHGVRALAVTAVAAHLAASSGTADLLSGEGRGGGDQGDAERRLSTEEDLESPESVRNDKKEKEKEEGAKKRGVPCSYLDPSPPSPPPASSSSHRTGQRRHSTAAHAEIEAPSGSSGEEKASDTPVPRSRNCNSSSGLHGSERPSTKKSSKSGQMTSGREGEEEEGDAERNGSCSHCACPPGGGHASAGSGRQRAQEPPSRRRGGEPSKKRQPHLHHHGDDGEGAALYAAAVAEEKAGEAREGDREDGEGESSEEEEESIRSSSGRSTSSAEERATQEEEEVEKREAKKKKKSGRAEGERGGGGRRGEGVEEGHFGGGEGEGRGGQQQSSVQSKGDVVGFVDEASTSLDETRGETAGADRSVASSSAKKKLSRSRRRTRKSREEEEEAAAAAEVSLSVTGDPGRHPGEPPRPPPCSKRATREAGGEPGEKEEQEDRTPGRRRDDACGRRGAASSLAGRGSSRSVLPEVERKDFLCCCPANTHSAVKSEASGQQGVERDDHGGEERPSWPSSSPASGSTTAFTSSPVPGAGGEVEGGGTGQAVGSPSSGPQESTAGLSGEGLVSGTPQLLTKEEEEEAGGERQCRHVATCEEDSTGGMESSQDGDQKVETKKAARRSTTSERTESKPGKAKEDGRLSRLRDEEREKEGSVEGDKRNTQSTESSSDQQTLSVVDSPHGLDEKEGPAKVRSSLSSSIVAIGGLILPAPPPTCLPPSRAQAVLSGEAAGSGKASGGGDGSGGKKGALCSLTSSSSPVLTQSPPRAGADGSEDQQHRGVDAEGRKGELEGVRGSSGIGACGCPSTKRSDEQKHASSQPSGERVVGVVPTAASLDATKASQPSSAHASKGGRSSSSSGSGSHASGDGVLTGEGGGGGGGRSSSLSQHLGAHANATGGFSDGRVPFERRSYLLIKKLNFILRHGAPLFKLPMREDGYVRIRQLLELECMRGVTWEEIYLVSSLSAEIERLKSETPLRGAHPCGE